MPLSSYADPTDIRTRKLSQHKLSMLGENRTQTARQIILQSLQFAIYRHVLRVGLRRFSWVQLNKLVGEVSKKTETELVVFPNCGHFFDEHLNDLREAVTEWTIRQIGKI